jgi:uncharacterized protein
MRPFLVNVADLVHKPAARRRERLSGRLADLRVGVAEVPAGEDVHVETTLEWVTDGLLASGAISAPWRAECQRCLGPARGRVDFDFRELFERTPREGESYRLGHDSIDMEPLVREAILLELPLVPLCAEGCRGLCPTCGADLNHGACGCTWVGADPRWAALEGFLAEAVAPVENRPDE